MSFLSSLADAGNSLLKVFLPSTTKLALGSTTITAAQLETSTGTLGTYFTAMSAAVKAKNYAAETELTAEEALTIATDLGIGEPYVGIAKILFPIMFNEAEQIITTPLVSVRDGAGGFVTKQWASDPREQLSPDGSFKN